MISIKASKQVINNSFIQKNDYRYIIENLKDAIVIIGLDGQFKYVSPQILKSLGRSGVEIKLDLITKIIHPDDHELVLEGFQRVIKENGNASLEVIEFRLLHQDGHYLWFGTSPKYFYNENGILIGIISILRDITALKEAKEKIRESEEKYKLIVENVLNDLIFVLNSESYILYVNPKALQRILGLNEVTHLQDLFNRTHPDDLKSFAKLMKLHWEIGEGSGVVRIRHRDGHYVWLEGDLKTYIDAKGQKKAIIISRDVTDRENVQQRLVKSQHKYRHIYENTNDLICVVNGNLKFDFINKNPHYALLGYYPHKLIGKDLLKFAHPADLPRLLETFKAIFKGREVTATCRFKRKNGTYLWLEVRGKSFINVNGKLNMLFVSRDITERKRIEALRDRLIEHIKRQNIELKQIDKLKDEFFADVAHDFRNPLTAIKGITEILLESENFPPKELQGLKTVFRNSLNLEHLIDELINYTKLKEGVLNLKKDTFKVSTIIANLKQDFEIKLNKRNIKLLEKYVPDKQIIIDQDQITRVLRNLLDNAIKFSKSNSEIKIFSKITTNLWRFSITDHGVGIKEGDIPFIFRRFSKLKDSEELNIKGIGLGLTICQNIIEKYNGKIWAESPGLGKGTTFFVEVPLVG